MIPLWVPSWAVNPDSLRPLSAESRGSVLLRTVPLGRRLVVTDHGPQVTDSEFWATKNRLCEALEWWHDE
ncbi:MAG: hypothetical protein ACYTBJ_20520 [Planctomycetota bacterium]|jgi:hypothetical protein